MHYSLTRCSLLYTHTLNGLEAWTFHPDALALEFRVFNLLPAYKINITRCLLAGMCIACRSLAGRIRMAYVNLCGAFLGQYHPRENTTVWSRTCRATRVVLMGIEALARCIGKPFQPRSLLNANDDFFIGPDLTGIDTQTTTRHKRCTTLCANVNELIQPFIWLVLEINAR